MRVRELLAVDIWNVHGGIEDTEIDSLLVALRHLVGLYTCRDFLLRDGNDRVNDELLSGIRPIDVCEVRQLYLSIGRIEKLIIDGGIALETDVIPCLQSDATTQLAYLQRPDIGEVARDDWQMALFIYETCSKTAQAILNNISYYIFNDLRHCVARELIEKSRGIKTNAVLVTHEEIANSLGTTRVVVSREIDKLRDLGIIETGRGKIMILDRAALEDIANQ